MRLRSLRGANAVEFALTAPVMFLTIFGVFYCGWYMCHKAVLNDITTEVARTVSYSAEETIGDYFSTAASKGIDKWADLGLPGSPTFQYEINDNNGTPITVTVTSEVRYDYIGPWDVLGSDTVSSSTMMSWQGAWQ